MTSAPPSSVPARPFSPESATYRDSCSKRCLLRTNCRLRTRVQPSRMWPSRPRPYEISEGAILAVTTSLGRGDARKWQPFERGGTRSPYAELLEKLYPIGCADSRLLQHSLVTMNYDINLDRCILNMWQANHGDLDLDYGIDLANYRLKDAMEFARPRARSVLLLRLHGSLNLLRCYSCYAVFTTVRKQVSTHEASSCPACS